MKRKDLPSLENGEYFIKTVSVAEYIQRWEDLEHTRRGFELTEKTNNRNISLCSRNFVVTRKPWKASLSAAVVNQAKNGIFVPNILVDYIITKKEAMIKYPEYYL